MPLGGPNEWPVPYQFDRLYIGGTWADQREVQQVPGPGCWALPTCAGTHIFQRPYRGALKPKDLRALQFSFQVLADGDTAWYALRELKAKCAPFYFGSGIRQVDVFAATSGQTLRLTSPLAAGIVPGITEGDYPTIVKLDGEVTPSAATVSGQSAVAAATGEITVIYTPVHRVWFSSFPESVAANNDVALDITLDEILVA